MPKIGERRPFQYQEEGIEWLNTLKTLDRDPGRGYLGDEPGLGKTRQLLMAAEGRTLAIVPAMILDAGVWQKEHQKWRPDLDLTLASYTSMSRLKKSPKGGNIPTGFLRPEYRDPWDTVIGDEIHMIKGRKTSWTVAIQRLKTDNFFIASGTPIPNWAYELFTALQVMFPTEARPSGRLGSYWRWAGEWFIVGSTDFSSKAILGVKDDTPEGWLRFYEENFRGRFLQRLRQDVLGDLPPMTRTELLLPMSVEQRRFYKALKKDYIAFTDSGGVVSAFSSGGLHTKLAQVATGLELVDPSTTKPSPKFQALEMNLRAQARPSLAIGAFRRTAELNAAAAYRAGKSFAVLTGATSKPDRRRIFADWHAGRIEVLCATFAIREGITMVEADTVHMVERSYVPSHNTQMINRVWRIGQELPVSVIDYTTRATVDQHKNKLLEEKSDQQMKALRAPEFAALL